MEGGGGRAGKKIKERHVKEKCNTFIRGITLQNDHWGKGVKMFGEKVNHTMTKRDELVF